MMTGCILACSAPVRWLLNGISTWPNKDNPWQAIVVMALFSMISAWFQWGISLIGSAMLALCIVRNNPKVDCRLLVVIILVITVLMALMHPSEEKTFNVKPELMDQLKLYEAPPRPKEMKGFSTWANWWCGWNVIAAAAGLWWLLLVFFVYFAITSVAFLIYPVL
jgi:short-chain fatty acids transporter